MQLLRIESMISVIFSLFIQKSRGKVVDFHVAIHYLACVTEVISLLRLKWNEIICSNGGRQLALLRNMEDYIISQMWYLCFVTLICNIGWVNDLFYYLLLIAMLVILKAFCHNLILCYETFFVVELLQLIYFHCDETM